MINLTNFCDSLSSWDRPSVVSAVDIFTKYAALGQVLRDDGASTKQAIGLTYDIAAQVLVAGHYRLAGADALFGDLDLVYRRGSFTYSDRSPLTDLYLLLGKAAADVADAASKADGSTDWIDMHDLQAIALTAAYWCYLIASELG